MYYYNSLHYISIAYNFMYRVTKKYVSNFLIKEIPDKYVLIVIQGDNNINSNNGGF